MKTQNCQGFCIIRFLDNFYPIAYNAVLHRREVTKPLQDIGSNFSLSNRVSFLQQGCGAVSTSSF